jgi:hypothetical protein
MEYGRGKDDARAKGGSSTGERCGQGGGSEERKQWSGREVARKKKRGSLPRAFHPQYI